MNTNTEQALESLIACFDGNAELDACSCLEIWRNERDAKRLAQEARAKAMAQETLYTVGLVGLVKMRSTGDTIVEVPRIVQRIRVRYADLPRFAELNGLNYHALMDVLELRRLEVSAKGRTWRNGHLSAQYIDRSPRKAEHEQRLLEDKELAVGKAMRDKVFDVPTSFREPTPIDWRPE